MTVGIDPTGRRAQRRGTPYLGGSENWARGTGSVVREWPLPGTAHAPCPALASSTPTREAGEGDNLVDESSYHF